MRKFGDLTDMDKGAYIVKEEIKKYIKKCNDLEIFICKNDQDREIAKAYFYGCEKAITICNELLDIATLGEIEK